MSDVLSNGECFHGYVVEKLLGRGGLGEVYLVRHEILDQMFALKVLLPSVAGENPEYVKRFVREAKIAARIRHPNLVQVHDVGYDEAKGVHYLVMDYIEGDSLRMAIAFGGAMKQDEAVRIVASVAGALSAGEALGIVHRDIKPENIMLTRSGQVKLVDFGVAKARGMDSLVTMPQTVFGTPNYISPEQAMDSGETDSRADVYSLGIVLFELLTGRRPYGGENPSAVLQELLSPEPLPDVRTFASDIPAALAELVNRLCEKDVSKRIPSASVLLEELSRLGYSVLVAQTDIQPACTNDDEKDNKPFDYSSFSAAKANNTLSFDTKDAAINEFVAKLKAAKRKRRLAAFLFLAIVVGLMLCGILFLLR